MAIRGNEWFYGRCLDEERSGGALAGLAVKALDLGIKGSASTRSHMNQGIGAAQAFFLAFPAHKATVAAASTASPYALKSDASMLRDWLTFFGAKSGAYGPNSTYSWDVLRSVLTQSLGGDTRGGGGGNNEFQIALRLAAAF